MDINTLFNHKKIRNNFTVHRLFMWMAINNKYQSTAANGSIYVPNLSHQKIVFKKYLSLLNWKPGPNNDSKYADYYFGVKQQQQEIIRAVFQPHI